jgi:hypothetical protein
MFIKLTHEIIVYPVIMKQVTQIDTKNTKKKSYIIGLFNAKSRADATTDITPRAT